MSTEIEVNKCFLIRLSRRCFFCGSYLLFVFVFAILLCLFLAALRSPVEKVCLFVCLFDLILYVPSTIFQLNRDGLPGWVEPVLS